GAPRRDAGDCGCPAVGGEWLEQPLQPGAARPARPRRILMVRDNDAATNAVIRAEGLTKVYTTGATEVRALRGVDIVVERGEMIAVMGSSGSGKSTLMNILGCLDSP